MRSRKHQEKPEFHPFKNPTPKVREAWSRIAGTLCATALAGAMIVAFNDPISYDTALRVSLQMCAAIGAFLVAVYALKGA
jgi:uncharacterized membrane protein